jgi:hypothetical protein
MVAEIDEYLKDNILHHYKVNSEVFNGLNTFINNRDKRLTSLFLRNLFNGKNGTIICNGINVVAEFQRLRKLYGKHNFDTCVRGRNTSKIEIRLGDNSIITTYCQMNFYKWLNEMGIDKWMNENIDTLLMSKIEIKN